MFDPELNPSAFAVAVGCLLSGADAEAIAAHHNEGAYDEDAAVAEIAAVGVEGEKQGDVVGSDRHLDRLAAHVKLDEIAATVAHVGDAACVAAG